MHFGKRIKFKMEQAGIKQDIMKLTGHTTLSAFEKYLRSIMSEMPTDVSGKYSLPL